MSSMDKEVLQNMIVHAVFSPTLYAKKTVIEIIVLEGQEKISKEIQEYAKRVQPALDPKIPEADTTYNKSGKES